MNQSWEKFLFAENASLDNNAHIVFPSAGQGNPGQIYPIANLSVLTVSGKDATKFLQGQMTCDVNGISETQGGLGAFCNPKGRAIATFLLVKNKDVFLLVMPLELLATVKNRLQMYILRAHVLLTDSSDDLCLIGLCSAADQQPALLPSSEQLLFATTWQEDGSATISLPQNRHLIIAEPQEAIAIWSKRVGEQDFKPGNSAQWCYHDITSGIPWLTTKTSEEFIPQMLNLDKLGGISFNKGCYTGQEIVARTHYLGKSKREMFLAACNITNPPEPNTAIIDENVGPDEMVGRVLQAQNQQNICKMLIVLQISETKTYNLKLKNHDRNKINLLTL